ncbi:MAG: hypothetical protein ACQEUF_01890 [Actinomycetota bacterium]
MNSTPAWALWLPLLGVVVGALLTHWIQSRRDEVAHQRAVALREQDQAREKADREARERAQTGALVQSLLVRAAEAELTHSFIRSVTVSHLDKSSNPLWTTKEVAARLEENLLEMTRITIAAALVDLELGEAAKEMEDAAKVPPIKHRSSDDVTAAARKFTGLATKWLRENTEGMTAHLRYQ